jgi:hypothetical protein
MRSCAISRPDRPLNVSMMISMRFAFAHEIHARPPIYLSTLLRGDHSLALGRVVIAGREREEIG